MSERWAGVRKVAGRAWAVLCRLVLDALRAARGGRRPREGRRGLGVAGPDTGMSTAEYAVGTIAAVAFAAVLYKVVSSTTVVQALTGLISRALSAPF